MHVTVTQIDPREIGTVWPDLVAHCRAEGSDLVLLPELGFSRWLAAVPDVDPAAWQSAADDHASWLARLEELGATTVVGTRPVVEGGYRYNESYLWSEDGCAPWRRKTYLPDEPGFWEATWYRRGPISFEATRSAAGVLGVQICTEMWFFEHAREYGAAGVELLLVPRATELRTLDKWIAGGRVAAVSSGAFCLSSNQSGSYPETTMAGGGWVTSPDGELLALTTHDEPFVTIAIDLDEARHAKSTYPRYVQTAPPT